ncbi:DUF2264 domain-containing protein [Jeotgalibaca sp. MA1X17-3]|uniref:DUF2264 domain-containing protein n=1 Tax=Jeotgalibaca sp. MA1X17-3 TaxID=2908211 RepID=UPI001F278B4C|nr:DUF2264 domain-containing protein [Jeotgalibaca sp. MA1X17-3]UJF15697.1 DUF2264 domain-containing protein [Jeotgalibaca sp. MA1X17-3]
MFSQQNLKINKFQTKEEYEKAFLNIINPLLPFYERSKPGRLKLGNTGTVYSEDIQEIEGFLRPLWGFAPFLTNCNHPTLEAYYLEGIKEGTNPESPYYWGEAGDYDQRLVEMASLANTLILAKDKTWDLLNQKEQDYLCNWLMQINNHTIPMSNWLFFRVLVNISMKVCGREWDQTQVKKDLDFIDTCYLGNGWYYDENPGQVDYYISFAIHYYSLLYCKYMKEEDPKRVKVFKERAIQFASTFKYWFDEKGEALPFGRSLSYRFSQSAFWSALVFADVEAIPWGEMKGILSRNMQQWMQKDIFSTEGLLTIGYHYPNLIMAEGYNGPGSPYWATKTFLLLAVPAEHPFWKAESLPIHYSEKQKAIPEARMLISQSGNQLQAYVAGQLEKKQAHVDGKYSKFVYSTTFGVSFSKGSIYYKQGGFDNCLALSEEETYYRSKLVSEDYEINDEYVISVWHPWKNVRIRTTIIPFLDWHVRIHEIHNERSIHAVEGGFSVPVEDRDSVEMIPNGIIYNSPVGSSAILALEGFANPKIQTTEPNTNIYFNRSVFPSVEKN